MNDSVAAIGPLQTILWKNAGFGNVAAMEKRGALEGYEPNHDPTVLPLVNSSETYQLETPAPQGMSPLSLPKPYLTNV